jgi:hypothetical protein
LTNENFKKILQMIIIKRYSLNLKCPYELPDSLCDDYPEGRENFEKFHKNFHFDYDLVELHQSFYEYLNKGKSCSEDLDKMKLLLVSMIDLAEYGWLKQLWSQPKQVDYDDFCSENGYIKNDINKFCSSLMKKYPNLNTLMNVFKEIYIYKLFSFQPKLFQIILKNLESKELKHSSFQPMLSFGIRKLDGKLVDKSFRNFKNYEEVDCKLLKFIEEAFLQIILTKNKNDSFNLQKLMTALEKSKFFIYDDEIPVFEYYIKKINEIDKRVEFINNDFDSDGYCPNLKSIEIK